MAIAFTFNGKTLYAPSTSWRHPDADLQQAMRAYCPSEQLGGSVDGDTLRLASAFIDILRRLSLHE